MVVNNGLSTHLSDSLACQILNSGVSLEDLPMFKHYNLPEQWKQLMLLTFAFLLFFTKQEITEQLPKLGKLVLQDMFKFFIIKMNKSNECFKQALGLYDFNNYIPKHVATDFRCYIYLFLFIDLSRWGMLSMEAWGLMSHVDR